MPGPTIRKTLPCAKCGYDLEGLAADGLCPECGADILSTLAVRLDPATESLERSPQLVRTGWAIYLMSLGSVLGCAIVLAPAIDAAIDAALHALSARERSQQYVRWRAAYASLDPGSYPRTTATAPFLYRGSAEERFVHALGRLLDGIAGRH